MTLILRKKTNKDASSLLTALSTVLWLNFTEVRLLTVDTVVNLTDFYNSSKFSQWYGYHEWNMSECLSTLRWLTSGMHDSSVVHCIFLLSRLLSLSFCKSLIHCKQ